MAGREFLMLTEMGGGTVWLDADQIVGVCDFIGDGEPVTIVYCHDVELPHGVREPGAEIMERLRGIAVRP